MAECETCRQVILGDEPCASCLRGAYGGLEDHEAQRLFEPAPEQMPGQLGIDLSL